MTEMIQRVALAFSDIMRRLQADGQIDIRATSDFADRYVARLIIETLREPTKEMLDAADGPWTDDDRPPLAQEYRTMIDAALGDARSP